MVGFALSCFGTAALPVAELRWPAPLKPKGYRFEVAFTEAAQLAPEADVRVAGVQVGKVREKRRDETDGNRTVATIEIDSRYAPIAADARAILRTKAILGETYIELTLGDRDGPRLAEGGRLANRQVQDSTQLDEILNALDPYTRKAFRTWQQELGKGVRNRGQDLNDAFGNLPTFVDEGGDLLEVLDEQRAALRGLVRNTGVVFGALTEREQQLRALTQHRTTSSPPSSARRTRGPRRGGSCRRSSPNPGSRSTASTPRAQDRSAARRAQSRRSTTSGPRSSPLVTWPPTCAALPAWTR